jgi:excisionase family DNA binding protein
MLLGTTKMTEDTNNLEWLTLAEVAATLRVSTRTVQRWAESGSVPAVTLPGGRRRISSAELERWLLELPRRCEAGDGADGLG